MRPSETILFELAGVPHRAAVRAILFTGTSRYLPDGRSDPWRELLVIEAESGAIVMRDRMRVKNGGASILSDPTWSVGTPESIIELLAVKAKEAPDLEQVRLMTRGLTALERWSRAEAV